MEAKGSFRKNLKKVEDSQPDLKGKWTTHEGKTYWLSVWRNVDEKTGDVWFSAKCGDEVKEQEKQVSPAKPKKDYDDVPF